MAKPVGNLRTTLYPSGAMSATVPVRILFNPLTPGDVAGNTKARSLSYRYSSTAINEITMDFDVHQQRGMATVFLGGYKPVNKTA